MAELPWMPQMTLDEFRMQCGLSQCDLAKSDGYWDQSAVSHLLKHPNPTVRSLLRFAEAVGVDLKIVAVKDGACYELVGP